jgi:uncharacterized protein (DUF488 family)
MSLSAAELFDASRVLAQETSLQTIDTIGFTRKTLQQFIERLRAADVREVIDIRLRNTSQLAGWSKYPDVANLLTAGFGMRYEHHLEFAPTAELLDEYHKTHNWPAYEPRFNQILAHRRLESEAQTLLMKEKICLLCTEPTADRCYRQTSHLFGTRPVAPLSWQALAHGDWCAHHSRVGRMH